MLVEAVEAGLVDDIDDGLLGLGDGERRVAGSHLTIRLHTEHGAEVGTLLRVAGGVARHGELSQAALHLVGHLSREGYLTVDVALQSDGNQFVGVRGKVFSCDEAPVSLVTVANDGRVEVQRAAIVGDDT